MASIRSIYWNRNTVILRALQQPEALLPMLPRRSLSPHKIILASIISNHLSRCISHYCSSDPFTFRSIIFGFSGCLARLPTYASTTSRPSRMISELLFAFRIITRCFLETLLFSGSSRLSSHLAGLGAKTYFYSLLLLIPHPSSLTFILISQPDKCRILVT
jgi:hypothetical protein